MHVSKLVREFGPDCGLDLEAVARWLGLSMAEARAAVESDPGVRLERESRSFVPGNQWGQRKRKWEVVERVLLVN